MSVITIFDFPFALNILFVSLFTLPMLILFTMAVPLMVNFKIDRPLISKKEMLGIVTITAFVWISASFLFRGITADLPSKIVFLGIPSLGATLFAYYFFDGFGERKRRIIFSILLGIIVSPSIGSRLGMLYILIHKIDYLRIAAGARSFEFPGFSLLEVIIFIFFLFISALVIISRSSPKIRILPVYLNALFVVLVLAYFYILPLVLPLPIHESFLAKIVIPKESIAPTSSQIVKLEKTSLITSADYLLSPNNTWIAERTDKSTLVPIFNSIRFASMKGDEVVFKQDELKKILELEAASDEKRLECIVAAHTAKDKELCSRGQRVREFADNIFRFFDFDPNPAYWVNSGGAGWSFDGEYFFVYDYGSSLECVFNESDRRWRDISEHNIIRQNTGRLGIRFGPFNKEGAKPQAEIVDDINYCELTCSDCNIRRQEDSVFRKSPTKIDVKIIEQLNQGRYLRDKKNNIDGVVLQVGTQQRLYFADPQDSSVRLLAADLNGNEVKNIRKVGSYKEWCGSGTIKFRPSPDRSQLIYIVDISGEWCLISPRTFFLLPNETGETVNELNIVHESWIYDPVTWTSDSKYFYYQGKVGEKEKMLFYQGSLVSNSKLKKMTPKDDSEIFFDGSLNISFKYPRDWGTVETRENDRMRYLTLDGEIFLAAINPRAASSDHDTFWGNSANMVAKGESFHDEACKHNFPNKGACNIFINENGIPLLYLPYSVCTKSDCKEAQTTQYYFYNPFSQYSGIVLSSERLQNKAIEDLDGKFQNLVKSIRFDVKNVTSGWIPYRNDKLEVEFLIPPNWSIRENIATDEHTQTFDSIYVKSPNGTKLEIYNHGLPGFGLEELTPFSTSLAISDMEAQRTYWSFIYSPDEPLFIISEFPENSKFKEWKFLIENHKSKRELAEAETILSTLRFYRTPPIDTSSWMRFDSKEHGFSIMYPPDWRVEKRYYGDLDFIDETGQAVLSLGPRPNIINMADCTTAISDACGVITTVNGKADAIYNGLWGRMYGKIGSKGKLFYFDTLCAVDLKKGWDPTAKPYCVVEGRDIAIAKEILATLNLYK